MSYSNVVLYGASLPTYHSKKDGKDKRQDIIKADDPRNRDKLRDFFKSIKD